MATLAPVTEPRNPRVTVKVDIHVDAQAKTIQVSPDPFYVSYGHCEEVEWVFHQPEDHPEIDCFAIQFADNDTPFAESTFGRHKNRSGCAVVHHGPKLFKYSVIVPGIGALDPKGGVTP